MLDLLASTAPGTERGIPADLYIISLSTLTAGFVTGTKGRWGWLGFGLLLLGFPWLISAFLIARPGSMWAGYLYDRENMAKAERRAARGSFLRRVRA